MKFKFLIVLFLFSSCRAGIFDWFSSKPETPEDKIAGLQKKQVDNPNDPVINYNLGVAYYKKEQFSQAKNNFTRALEHTADQVLKKQTLFNLGNSSYKHCLAQLPKNWEKPDVSIENILELMTEVQEAIKHYKDLLTVDPEHIQAKKNLKKAEELLKKLEKKMKQQQQKNDDKKDDKKEKNKDNKDQKEQDQQNKNQSQDSDGKSDSKDQKEDRSEQGDKSQEQGGRKDQSDQPRDGNQQGKDQKSDDDQAKDKEQKDYEHKDASEKEQQSDTPNKQSEDTASGAQEQAGKESGHMAAGNEEKEGIEMKGMRAVLESVQADESKTQKQLIMQKVGAGKSPATNQKPW